MDGLVSCVEQMKKILLSLPLQRETFHSPFYKGQEDFLTSRVANPIQEGETDFDAANLPRFNGWFIRTTKGGSRSMKSYRKEIWFNTPTRVAFVNITPQVQDCLRESGVKEGLVLVNAMHITASVFINDDESGLHHDYGVWLEKLAPHEPIKQYRHNDTGEDNADAHMKRQVMGREVVVAITEGKLDFGPWEQIFYGEFDGRRRKRVLVKIIGE